MWQDADDKECRVGKQSEREWSHADDEEGPVGNKYEHGKWYEYDDKKDGKVVAGLKEDPSWPMPPKPPAPPRRKPNRTPSPKKIRELARRDDRWIFRERGPLCKLMPRDKVAKD